MTRAQLLDLPQRCVIVAYGRTGCRDELKALNPLFDPTVAGANISGLSQWCGVAPSRWARRALLYACVTSAKQTVFEVGALCWKTKRELYFDGDDGFGGLFR